MELANGGTAYAGFWCRLLAVLIDTALLLGVQVSLVVGVALMAPGDLRAAANLAPVSLAMFWAYFALLESSPLGATVGKIALEIYVTDAHGDPISFARASARYWLKTLSTLTLMVGWLMAAFTPQKQALHDVFAGTLVLRKGAATANVPPPVTEMSGEQWDGSQWVVQSTIRGEG
ncbi:MAG: hypothetical protein AUG06_05230 [Actinobacteria bacterium 13_1_20CM_2_65_11]|nr:MAG: hypothetical protein AUH40_07815 [Chloroflexi bacterium 13_1_40CM_65_17]OLC67528.1 MAG: hypothetical protein AUH69_03610 [Actinobacteria bacterium 13_1_40CM_4_65_12]OLD23947.1 MAG: hypothetical protein AUJ02_09355 [Chloroflexi bacterium 13_1_40CM_3_65_12]OLD49462.1 MAG: hypothetical protein AUI42_07720 [Actinobacteria bacterium 13_1_40CM_2_65_8]OLE80313.1 MAG: hypothetical protein AUG06_05230 [Actinobacteria bacterium 13_1_20CM_2_65_11]